MDVTVADGWTFDDHNRIVSIATTEMVATTTARRRIAEDEVQTVFDEWVRVTGRTGRTRLDVKRRKVIQRALSDYSLPDVLDAVRGWQHDPWPERVNHTDVTQLLRDAEHIEKFRRLWREGPPKVRVEPKGYRAIRNTSPDPGAFDASMAMLFGRGNGQQHLEAIEATSEEVK
jgi:hypothetical protein